MCHCFPNQTQEVLLHIVAKVQKKKKNVVLGFPSKISKMLLIYLLCLGEERKRRRERKRQRDKGRGEN